MYYREVVIQDAMAIVGAQTITRDINVTDPISKLSVIYRKTNTDSTPVAHPGKMMINITVCDGADVLFSMNGMDAQAMAMYTDNKQIGSIINYVNGQGSTQVAEIKFGRWLYDEKLALDPKRFNNLQIKCQMTPALGGSGGANGTLEIYCHCFDEKVIEPIGWLFNKEIYSYLPVANAWNYIDLPTDYPIRAVMFGANECEDGPQFNIQHFRLTENQGKHVLVDNDMIHYQYISSAYYDPWNEMVYACPDDNNAFDIYVTPHWERQSHVMDTLTAQGVANFSTQGCLQQIMSAAFGNVHQGWVFGHAPFGQTFVQTYGGQDLGDCWNIEYSGSGRLELHDGAGPDLDEYMRVYIQQIRKY